MIFIRSFAICGELLLGPFAWCLSGTEVEVNFFSLHKSGDELPFFSLKNVLLPGGISIYL